MDTTRYKIPRYLNEPTRILIFTVDEFMALIIPTLLLFLLFDHLLVGMIIGTAGLLALRKLKGVQGHAFLWQWFYWHCSILLPLRATPPSYQRDFIG